MPLIESPASRSCAALAAFCFCADPRPAEPGVRRRTEREAEGGRLGDAAAVVGVAAAVAAREKLPLPLVASARLTARERAGVEASPAAPRPGVAVLGCF